VSHADPLDPHPSPPTPTKRKNSRRHPTNGMNTNHARVERFEPTTRTPMSTNDDRASERAIVERARAGDVAAFELLYHEHASRVYAICLRMTADARRARELTQDVFVRAWERLSAFRGDAAFASWLHRIAVNEVLMGARADKRRTSRVALAEDVEGVDGHADGEAMSGDVEQEIDLERAIAALPPGARRVFVLHDVEGYKHEEIARMTGTAPGTLRAQLHRARRLLMEALRT
jgi:RNA polymerase sigma-70 factor, ECF subfamily